MKTIKESSIYNEHVHPHVQSVASAFQRWWVDVVTEMCSLPVVSSVNGLGNVCEYFLKSGACYDDYDWDVCEGGDGRPKLHDYQRFHFSMRYLKECCYEASNMATSWFNKSAGAFYIIYQAAIAPARDEIGYYWDNITQSKDKEL